MGPFIQNTISSQKVMERRQTVGQITIYGRSARASNSLYVQVSFTVNPQKQWDLLMHLAMGNSSYHLQGDYVIKENVVNLKKRFATNLRGLQMLKCDVAYIKFLAVFVVNHHYFKALMNLHLPISTHPIHMSCHRFIPLSQLNCQVGVLSGQWVGLKNWF